MYEWTFGIFGIVVIGRTWEEYTKFIDKLRKGLNVSVNVRLVCYTHNLAFEFDFMRLRFKWKKVFSLDVRKPVYALTTTGIEYRCSLILSGYSLAKVAENLTRYEIKKLVGDLDYTLPRHSQTPLSDEELAYCINDVKIVMAYIAEQIEDCKGIANIPLTKTGFVRKFCRDRCFYEEGVPRDKSWKRYDYRTIINALQITDVEEYDQLHRAFSGGFTHGNAFAWNVVQENVTSFDFTSSYPTVLVAEQFPMSRCTRRNITSKEELEKYLSLYCCLFDVEMWDVQPKVLFENYLSESRCFIPEGENKEDVDYETNNGRIVRAKHLYTTFTEQDYIIFRKFYHAKVRIYNFRTYKKAYLPTDFVRAILELYRDKTTLKSVPGKEVEYMRAKSLLNAAFGMCAMNPILEQYVYKNGKWGVKTPDKKMALMRYNTSGSRFLFYHWGIWCCAYARRNLFTGVLEFKQDYVYSDTDSIKVINAEDHMDYINDYNYRIGKQLERAMRHHDLPLDLIAPANKYGKKKPLGVWSFDGHYARFKQLGAKRYMVQYSDDPRNDEEDRGKISITVSGLNKTVATPYICTGWAYTLDGREQNCPFDKFEEGLYVPPGFTGKLTHTYIIEERAGELVDYLGNPGEYHELSGVHLSETDYTMSISESFANYLYEMGMKNEKVLQSKKHTGKRRTV